MLTPDEFRQLDRVTLGPLPVPPTPGVVGARVARVRGYSADWHDYRAYEPGDDPRGIDWNIYARLRQLAVKVSRADAHVELHLLVDSSRSMSIGDPQKLSCAARLAAAIAYVTLAQHDRVAFAGFDHVLRGAMQPAAGRAQGRRILDALSELRPHGPSSSASALRAYACTVRGPAFAVVLSDFLEADDPRAGLRELLQAGIVPAVVQIVADEELDPSIEGEVELVDIEHPELAPSVANRSSVTEYRNRLRQLTALLGEFCATHGVPRLQIRSSCGFGNLLQACVTARLLAVRG